MQLPAHATEVHQLKAENIELARALHRERIVASQLYLENLDRQQYELMDEIAKAEKPADAGTSESNPAGQIAPPSNGAGQAATLG